MDAINLIEQYEEIYQMIIPMVTFTVILCVGLIIGIIVFKKKKMARQKQEIEEMIEAKLNEFSDIVADKVVEKLKKEV